VKQPLVQILVKVANTQVGILWTKVGKGFMTIEFSHDLVDPKVMVNSTKKFTSLFFLGISEIFAEIFKKKDLKRSNLTKRELGKYS